LQGPMLLKRGRLLLVFFNDHGLSTQNGKMSVFCSKTVVSTYNMEPTNSQEQER
jgi:hypothetical protein